MRVRIHARNIDREFRLAMYGMVEYSMVKLIPSKRLRNNLEINVHVRKHAESGEAMVDEFANRRNPRSFRVILDPSKMKYNDSGEERSETEVAYEILKTLGHELVHVKQYVTGDLAMKAKGMYWKGELTDIKSMKDYFKSPWEVEAYGLERYLWMNFIDFWSENIEKKLDSSE